MVKSVLLTLPVGAWRALALRLHIANHCLILSEDEFEISFEEKDAGGLSERHWSVNRKWRTH
jgi:hypothetical protein